MTTSLIRSLKQIITEWRPHSGPGRSSLGPVTTLAAPHQKNLATRRFWGGRIFPRIRAPCTCSEMAIQSRREKQSPPVFFPCCLPLTTPLILPRRILEPHSEGFSLRNGWSIPTIRSPRASSSIGFGNIILAWHSFGLPTILDLQANNRRTLNFSTGWLTN